jgi:hypothetical protein
MEATRLQILGLQRRLPLRRPDTTKALRTPRKHFFLLVRCAGMPTRAEIMKRLSALRKARAIPGWLLAVVAVLKQWDFVDFTLGKAERYGIVEFFASPAGMLSLALFAFVFAVLRPGVRPQTPREKHFVTLKSILKEASERQLAQPQGNIKSFDEFGDRTWPYMRTTVFVEMAFNHRVETDFAAYMKSEIDKSSAAGQSGNLSHLCGTYLADLNRRLTHDDVDFGFVLPRDWDHFLDGGQWPPNRRPAEPLNRN